MKDEHMKKIANGIIGVYEHAHETGIALNGVDAERAIRAATTSIIASLADKIDSGEADHDIYESVLAMMLAHQIIKAVIAREGANRYRFTIDGGFETNVKD